MARYECYGGPLDGSKMELPRDSSHLYLKEVHSLRKRDPHKIQVQLHKYAYRDKPSPRLQFEFTVDMSLSRALDIVCDKYDATA